MTIDNIMIELSLEVFSMSGNPQQKLKLLKLIDILSEQTDDEHPLSALEIVEQLQKSGINAERKSIYSDLQALGDYGLDVVCTRTPRTGFFLGNRDFELPEVRLLVDAVLTAPFITPKKTKELTDKLKSLISRYQADSLLKQVCVDQRVKFDNEQIYYNIDCLHKAITLNKRVSFTYYHTNIINNRLELNKGRRFIISPYALLWSDDKYYLAGNYEKYPSVSNYRLDRMRHVEITDEPSRSFEEVSEYRGHFDAADYLRKNFNMFCGEPQQIELRCENDTLEVILDRFGSDGTFHRDDDSHFILTANVYISEGLAEWLVQYGGRIVVLSPSSLRQKITAKIASLCEAYQVAMNT